MHSRLFMPWLASAMYAMWVLAALVFNHLLAFRVGRIQHVNGEKSTTAWGVHNFRLPRDSHARLSRQANADIDDSQAHPLSRSTWFYGDWNFGNGVIPVLRMHEPLAQEVYRGSQDVQPWRQILSRILGIESPGF